MTNLLNPDQQFKNACSGDRDPIPMVPLEELPRKSLGKQSPYLFVKGENGHINACTPDNLPKETEEYSFVNLGELHRKWVWIGGKQVFIENIDDINFLEA